MANAPLVGQDGVVGKVFLPDGGSGIFFPGYLDDPNRLVLAVEFSVQAQAQAPNASVHAA
jgi:hypothetical protein